MADESKRTQVSKANSDDRQLDAETLNEGLVDKGRLIAIQEQLEVLKLQEHTQSQKMRKSYGANTVIWEGEIQTAPDSNVHFMPLVDDPFIPNTFQRSILNSLEGRALKVDALAGEVCGSDRSRLYKSGGLNELKEAGKVCHKHRLGYYRPDAPPTST